MGSLHVAIRYRTGRIDDRKDRRGRLPECHKIENLLDRLVGRQLDKVALLREGELRKSNRGALLLDDLDQLHGGSYVDLVGRARLLPAQEGPLDHGRHAPAASDKNDANGEVGSGEGLPADDLTFKDLRDLMERSFAHG